MNYKYILLGLIASFYSFLGWHGFFPATTTTYEKTENDKKEKIKINVETKENDFHLSFQTAENKISAVCDPNGNFKTFRCHFLENDLRYYIKRQNDLLLIKGKQNGQLIRKSHAIKDKHWIQDFFLGLKPFLKSGNQKMIFYLINPKDLSLNKMTARKYRKENIRVNGKNYKTQKVIIHPKGFKSIFFKEKLWYDLKTYQLIKYEGRDYLTLENCSISLLQ